MIETLKEDIYESMNLTQTSSLEDEVKVLLIKIDSTLLYIINRAEENEADLAINYDLPVYFHFNYSSENVGNFSEKLFVYLKENNVEVYDLSRKKILNAEDFDTFLITSKLSVLEHHLYFSTIKSKVRKVSMHQGSIN